MSVDYKHSNQRMSQLVIHNQVAYLAGQVAADHSADMRTQTEQVLAKIDALLEEAGSSKSQLLSATIWVKDMAEFAEMNAVWDAWVAGVQPPARACVQAAMAHPDFKVEVMVVAAVGV